MAQFEVGRIHLFGFHWEGKIFAHSAIRASLLGLALGAISLAAAMAIALAVPATARSHRPALVHAHPNDDLSAAERYAWGQIRQGLPANFSEKCDDWLDPKHEDDPNWRDEIKSQCRTLSATFIVDLLTRPSFRDAMTYKGVDIRGAKIVGDIDLAFAKLERPVQISESRFEGGISLRFAHAMSIINLEGSDVSGWLDATGLHSEGEFSLQRTKISESGITLSRATIAGLVNMRGMSCAGELRAESIQLGNSLFLSSDQEDKAKFKKVILTGAKVANTLSLDGATFGGDLSLNNVEVGKSLFMRSYGKREASFNNVDLKAIIVSNEIDLSGAHFRGDLDARSIQVGGSLFMDAFPEQKNRFGRMNRTSFEKVNLRNSRITGQVDLSGSSFDGNLDASFMQVGGSLLMRSIGKAKAIFKIVDLSGANVAGRTDMRGASFNGSLNAESLQVGQSLLMESDGTNETSFKKVILRGAKISGQVSMNGTSFDGDLDARFLQVGGALLMDSGGKTKTKSRFRKVDLRSAKISGEISMGGTSLDGDLYAPFLQVGGSMFMRSVDDLKASFKTVDLSNARIQGQIDFSGAGVDGNLNADFLQVGGSLLMRSDESNKASFRTVNLRGASIAGGIVLDRAIFGGSIIGQGLRVAADVSARDVYTDAPIAMPFAQLGGNLDIRGSNLASLDLRGAAIVGEMQLGDKDSMVGWLDSLDLRNAHVGSLSDNKFSWPRHLHLDGVSFAHLGGSEGDSGADMVKRGADWWDRNFAQLEKDFTASPYEQLAAAFGGAGYRDLADEIHYDEQLRATEKSSALGLAGSTLMRWGAGYGIGSYMFRALYWAIGLSLIGALILRFRVKGVVDRNHGFLWCFGASANKLLPGVSLKKEFADFFDDPEHNKFTPRQDLFFVVLAALGWVLSLIVLAAFATITHGP